MISIRARLLIALLALVGATSLLAGTLTYRRVLEETSTLFDYQLRQMALSLRSQIPMAPRLELPPDQACQQAGLSRRLLSTRQHKEREQQRL